MAARVFLSRPSQLTPSQQAHWQRWADALACRGFNVKDLPRDSYARDPWKQLRGHISGADGVLVLGLRQLSVGVGVWRPGTPEEQIAASYLTSAWMHLEAGMAIMAGVPTLIVAEAGVEEGVFDPRTWIGLVHGAALDSPAVDDAVGAWAATVVANMNQTGMIAHNLVNEKTIEAPRAHVT